MLTHVIADHLSTAIGQAWLKSLLKSQPSEWRVDFDNNLEFPELDIRWSSGRIIKLLKRSPPELVIPLLWEINRQYDDGEQTSAYLRKAIEKSARCKLDPVPFYRHEHRLVLTCSSKKLPKSTAEIRCKTQEDKLILQPSTWLRDVLVDFLKERAL